MSRLILSVYKNLGTYSQEDKYHVEYETSSKFHKDKLNFENDFYHILIDGIVLNKKQLSSANNKSDWVDYLIKEFIQNGNTFHNKLKGSYYGFFIDKRARKYIVFTDHISSKPMYYMESDHGVIFSNDYSYLMRHLKTKNITVSLNEQAANLLLTYGYVFEDITITNEIKRLMVGYNALFENEKLIFTKYYELKNDPIAISEDDAIEEIDRRFRDAVHLSFEKDIEYGYKHIAALSGGLDSRMTVSVAHDLGYTDQLNITFSQSEYLDETIAKKIASELRHEWIFKALDNGNFLKKIDETTKITGGNVLYYGLAHGLSLYNYINFNNLGIVHSGQLGDVIIGTFSSLDKHKQFKFGDGAYSKLLLYVLQDFKFREFYKNEEIFKMYIRGFYGANQGLQGIQKFTETYSPFYDIDFMEFALSVPVELRFNHYLYKKWIINKYPLAAKYVWEKDKVPVNYKYWLKVRERSVPFNQIPVKIFSKLDLKKYGSDTKNNMNPLNYWYKTNIDLKNNMDDYFENNIDYLDDYMNLKNNCYTLYYKGINTEKVQVLSLLSATKRIYK